MARVAQRLRCLCIVAVLALSGCPRPEEPRTAEATPAPTPGEPKPTPPPPPYVPYKRLETGRIFNGMQYQVRLETDFGTTATRDRAVPENYAAELIVKVKVPKPHLEIAELVQLNPQLSEVLPSLPQLVEQAKVSPFFDDLYRLKVANLRSNLNRLDILLSRHNFYDTETILELEHPETKRRALLIQSDMDVDEDGSDPDRVPVVDGSSLTFQPFTSYRWLKKSTTVNPFLAGRQANLAKAERDLAAPGLSPAKTKELKSAAENLKAEIYSLTRYSFLVGAVDPFIVLPGSMVNQASPFSPRVGDFCVVIFKNVLFPAIVGDVGPRYKSGEAALRICKEINARSGSMNRPVSDLKVTYLVFPNTVEKPFAAPNLEHWTARCAQLVEELGGHQGQLFAWTDLTKPPPPPAPAPTENAEATAPPAAPQVPANSAAPVSTPSPAPAVTPTAPAEKAAE